MDTPRRSLAAQYAGRVEPDGVRGEPESLGVQLPRDVADRLQTVEIRRLLEVARERCQIPAGPL